jgi:hypothetical protein
MILYMDGARAVTLGVMLLAVALRGTERRLVRGLDSQRATAPDRAVDSSGLGRLSARAGPRWRKAPTRFELKTSRTQTPSKDTHHENRN